MQNNNVMAHPEIVIRQSLYYAPAVGLVNPRLHFIIIISLKHSFPIITRDDALFDQKKIDGVRISYW